MADRQSYLNMLPTVLRVPLEGLFRDGATLVNSITGNVTGNVSGNLDGQVTTTVTMAAYSENVIKVTTTCADTTGSSQNPVYMTHTFTGAGACGGRAYFLSTYNGTRPGGWTNALKGEFAFGASCTLLKGLHSAICCEMTAPNANVSAGGGHLTCLEIELNLPADFVPTTNWLSMINMNANTTPATFDTYGVLFELNGVTGGDNKVFDDSLSGVTNPQIEGSLRILINNVAWYIPLCDTPNMD